MYRCTVPTVVFSPAYTRRVGPASLQHNLGLTLERGGAIEFDVVKIKQDHTHPPCLKLLFAGTVSVCYALVSVFHR